MRFVIGVCAVLGFVATAQGADVAIVDSGTDFRHDLLAGHPLINANEVAGNIVDDDRNGKVDDVVGWNFADASSTVFYGDHVAQIHPIVYRIFEVLGRRDSGTLTEEDKEFWNKSVIGLPEEIRTKLINHLNFYGQYAHGTHCSGIVVKGNPLAKIMSARIFPDGLPPVAPKLPGDEKHEGLLYSALAQNANAVFLQVGSYLHERNIQVANYSVGIPLSNLAKQFLALRGKKSPSAAEIAGETKKVFEAFAPKGKQWMGSSPDTLFVVAAGNDGSDNDVLPVFPAAVDAKNSITVAASFGVSSLATFSNWGKKSVHVAAPGVAIRSSVPGPTRSFELPMSGTSMAAPFVTGLASRLKDENSALKPADIKRILMETVDKKAWLADKVISSGVVNSERAVAAARLARTLPIAEALAKARAEISDAPEMLLSHRAEQHESLVEQDMRAWAERLRF